MLQNAVTKSGAAYKYARLVAENSAEDACMNLNDLIRTKVLKPAQIVALLRDDYIECDAEINIDKGD